MRHAVRKEWLIIMTVTSVKQNCLYVNITNNCTNRCVFCTREPRRQMPVQAAEITQEREPTLDEIISDVLSFNPGNYKEIIFRGTGEPTCRLYDMLAICRKIREVCDTPIHVYTNGHASLILGEDTAPLFKGLVDIVSIELNAPDSESYLKLCRPRFGEDTFAAVLRFAREIVRYVPEVIMTAVNGTLSDEDAERCVYIAHDIGVKFMIVE